MKRLVYRAHGIMINEFEEEPAQKIHTYSNISRDFSAMICERLWNPNIRHRLPRDCDFETRADLNILYNLN